MLWGQAFILPLLRPVSGFVDKSELGEESQGDSQLIKAFDVVVILLGNDHFEQGSAVRAMDLLCKRECFLKIPFSTGFLILLFTGTVQADLQGQIFAGVQHFDERSVRVCPVCDDAERQVRILIHKAENLVKSGM